MSLTPAQIEFDDQGRLVSTTYGDIYFQPEDSIAESEYVFLDKAGFFDAVQNGTGDVTVAELGFGTGLNFLLCLRAWETRTDKKRRLHYISFEKHPIRKTDIEKIYNYWPNLSDYSKLLLKNHPLFTGGIHPVDFNEWGAHLTLCLGDVRNLLPDMQFKSDIWFLDGFAPAKNPAMWSEKLWHPLARNTKTGGRISTFTAAGAVRRGLQSAGFEIKKTSGYGRKRDMLTGHLKEPATPKTFDAKHLPPPPVQKYKTVAVIGAGIAGCALAEALTRHGLNVKLYDQNPCPAAEASGNPLAAVYPKISAQSTLADQIYRQAFAYTQNFYCGLHGSTFNPCGVFIIDRNEDIKSRHQKIAARGLDHDLVQYIDRDIVSGLDLDCGGLFIPKGGTVSPTSLCHALLNVARGRGRLTETYNLNFKKITDIDADIIIIADGTNINQTAETSWIPVEIVRGQTTGWVGSDNSRNLKTVICHKGYITPHQNGSHCLGATFDKGAAETTKAENINHKRNMTQLFDELPHLKTDYDMEGLSGRQSNRVATPDRLPLCGPVIDINQFKKIFATLAQDAKTVFDQTPEYHAGLYVLGALGSHGMTTAPWCAEILARHLSGQGVPVTLSVYNALSPTRFAVRDLIRGSD